MKIAYLVGTNAYLKLRRLNGSYRQSDLLKVVKDEGKESTMMN
ncbi:MAG: hypothetical protein ACFWT6_08200 [Virgibacillus proomii]|jgi:hypothetical protein